MKNYETPEIIQYMSILPNRGQPLYSYKNGVTPEKEYKNRGHKKAMPTLGVLHSSTYIRLRLGCCLYFIKLGKYE